MSEKLNYLKRGKSLLKSVRDQRAWLLKHQKGYIHGQFVETELKNIEGAMVKIKSADQMQTYLQRKESELRYLIPANNKKRRNELQELLETNLQG